MMITRVRVHEYDVAYAHGPYAMSRGRVADSERSLVVRIDTDEGLTGWAETCPNGRTYLPSSPEGERAALSILAPAVLGADPRLTSVLADLVDSVLLGSLAAKGALDMACWDILGQSVGLPVHALLGGARQESVPLFVGLPFGDDTDPVAFVEEHRALGVGVFQVKVGGDPLRDAARVRTVVEAAGPASTVLADANCGWSLSDALVGARAMDGLPVRLEQPCRSFAEMVELRRHTALPLVFDELVVTVEDLVRAKLEAGATGVNLKPGRLGGFTRLRALRDVAQELGMTFTIDDTWGGAIVSAQNAHLAASSAPERLTATTYFNQWTVPSIAEAPGVTETGRGVVPTAPGLGVEPDLSLLSEPTVDVGL